VDDVVEYFDVLLCCIGNVIEFGVFFGGEDDYVVFD